MAVAAGTALLWRRLAPSVSAVAGMVGSSSSSSSSRGFVAAAVTRPVSYLLGRAGAGLRRPIGAPSGLVAAPAAVTAPSGGMTGLLVPAARGAWQAWGGQPGAWLGSLWARWSSTLKKRRSKMNKHKLKKRRKLMRNKNKKNL